MDPDKALEEIIENLLDTPDREYLLERLNGLEEWHYTRGYLPRWPVVHSPSQFIKIELEKLSGEGPVALQFFRAQCIEAMARIQVSIESENRAVYISAIGYMSGWVRRAVMEKVA